MAGPIKVEIKPHFEPEFIQAWMAMADAFANASKEIRAAGERLLKLYEQPPDEDEADA